MRDTSDLPKYWEQLESDMLKRGHFFASRVKHVLLRQTHRAGRSVIRPPVVEGEAREPIWGHLARLKCADLQWQEIALAYVRKDKEGNGVLREMMAELLQATPKGICLFLITDVQVVIETAAALGFHIKMFPTQELLDAWARQMGFPAERKPPEGAVVRNVAQAVRDGRQTMLRTLMVRE